MINRRGFLKASGSLIVYFSLSPAKRVYAQGSVSLPGGLRNNPQLDSWIKIAADGIVTIYPGKVELGQGVVTALGQIAAEELRIGFERIRMSPVDTDHSPNEGITAGSMSIEQSGSALRIAAAEAHQILTELAANELKLDVKQISVRDGDFIVNGEPVALDYWRLIGNKEFDHSVYGKAAVMDPESHRIVGTSAQRLDIPAKVYAEAIFIHDIRLPGMLHARVVRPPAPGAKLLNVDIDTINRIPGVRNVVRDGSFLAVIAEREELAIKGVQKLKTLCRWSKGTTLPDVNNMTAWLHSAAANVSVIAERGTLASGNKDKIFSAEYSRPYQAHASISPSIAVARSDADGLTVWSHAQGMYLLRDAIAKVIGLDANQVRCIHAQGCGCYGHNGADDAACDAAIIAMHMPGAAIRLQYSREDEFRWEPYGSAMAMRVEAELDDEGMIKDWQYHVWSCTHSTRPMGANGAGNLFSANLISNPVPKPAPGAIPQPNGGGDRNAVPLYQFPNMRIHKHFIPEMPLRVSALRTLGAYANVFAIESFMDELAKKANIDPIEFRIAHLQDQRAIDALIKLKEISDWTKPLAQGTGKGIGFARYKNRSAYCAVVVFAQVDRETGEISLKRAVSVTDAGLVINPDGLKNQIEGGIIQAASWTLKEQVFFTNEQVTTLDWASYPVLKFSETPEVEVELINHPELPSLGVGEASQGPATAAIANAVADVIGNHIRDIPFTKERVLKTLAS